MQKVKLPSTGFSRIYIVIIIVLLAICLIGGLVYGHKDSRPLYRVSNSKTKSAAQPVTKTITHKKVSMISTLTTPEGNLIKIPELNIQIEVPDPIKDLVYVINTTTLKNGNSATYAFFSTTSLTNLDANCSTANGPLGSLEEASGQYPASDSTPQLDYGELVRQFPSFYISAGFPQAACSQTASVNDLAESQNVAFSSSQTTITQLAN